MPKAFKCQQIWKVYRKLCMDMDIHTCMYLSMWNSDFTYLMLLLLFLSVDSVGDKLQTT